MGWSPRQRDRWGQDDWRDEPVRGRSRSSSRDRHRRRHSSRSRSRGRWQPDCSISPDKSYRHGRSPSRDRSRSRSRERRWRRRSRSASPRRHRRSSPLPAHPLPPWQAGPGAEVPPWHAQAHPYPPPHERWQHPDADLGPVPPHHRGLSDPSERCWDRSRSRGSDTDRDWDLNERERRARLGPGPGYEVPSASVFIKGLPADADESDIYAAFSNFPNIHSVKVLRDRATGRGKGTAFLDFVSAADAQVLMESDARCSTSVGGQLLYLDYSSGPPVGGAGPGGPTPALDWICDMCSAVNFARRLECYHCSSARPANPHRVTADLNEPSHILKVSGLEPQTSEEELYAALSAVGQTLLDLRVIKDKYTGAPRGFAFVELPSVAAAGSVMLACQGLVLPGQATPLKICYAKAKEKLVSSAAAAPDAAGVGDGPSDAAGLGGDGAAGTVAAAAAPQATEGHALAGPLGWKPKEFNPNTNTNDDQQLLQQQQQGQATASAASYASAAAAASDAPAGPGPSSEAAAASAAAAAAAGVDAATIQALTQAGFVFQESSGYWWDAKSGYFYDTKTQLYYHHSTNQWYQYNQDTGQYTAVGGEQQQQQQLADEQQQQSVPGTAANVVGPAQQQKQASAADKRRRAVIGSAPQYNPEGLLAAAALAQEREAEQQRVAAAKAARERQQQQQNKHSNKQPPLMPGKPGIGMLPGTGGAGRQEAASAPAAASPAAQVVAHGNLQGVVYRSKWSQQRAQQAANLS